MAKKMSGDWRNPDRIRAWAAELAAEIPTATPGKAIEHPARSIPRLLMYGVVGWALCATTMAVLLYLVSHTIALALHAIATPLIFAVVACHYFRARGARDATSTAIVWTATVALLDLIIIAGFVQHSLTIFKDPLGAWVPLGLILATTWITGEMMAIVQTPGPHRKAPYGSKAHTKGTEIP
jgi:hypothetical protein